MKASILSAGLLDIAEENVLENVLEFDVLPLV